ncbi:MAG: DUF2716 domain-containing protein [Nocardioides sp.]|uniref:DUF2716 domain-containing protein n=1 Tax=Nocardioides sp. TaxID=35761 RepID=UPI0039E55722
MEEASDVWREVDYDSAWTPFNERFGFVANYYERDRPAVQLPPDSLVIDLSPVFEHNGPRFAAGEAGINAAALRAFVWLVEGDELVALDWQHPAYRYSPGRQALSDDIPAIPVFPNGDYYAHMTPDLRWGTFGHPWQQTLTIWGNDLIATLGAELLTWLPRHPQSPT